MDAKTRVLFVDDEENVLHALRRILRQMKDRWDMCFVTDGHEALRLMERQPFDVIVSDMLMPKMSGDKLLNTVKERYPETARIVLSGHCNQATAFRLVGSDHFYLSKPCPRKLFIDTIEHAIHFHRPPGKEAGALTNEEVVSIMADFSRKLLLRGVIELGDIPEGLRHRLSDNLLEFFAPVVEDMEGMDAGGNEYVSQYLDIDGEDAASLHWIFPDEEEPA